MMAICFARAESHRRSVALAHKGENASGSEQCSRMPVLT